MLYIEIAFHAIEELDEAKSVWNTHLIRKQPWVLTGIPDELFYIPETIAVVRYSAISPVFI